MGFSTILPFSSSERYWPGVIYKRISSVVHARTVPVYRTVSEEEVGMMVLKPFVLPLIKQQLLNKVIHLHLNWAFKVKKANVPA